MSETPEARLIGVIELPIPIPELGALAYQYPTGSTISQVVGDLWVRSPGETCWGCIACTSRDAQDFLRITGRMVFSTFIVCPDCGNKRCPRASHHDSECSGSNEPGQNGSVYA